MAGGPTWFTLARWHVSEGREQEFIDAWTGDLAAVFRSLERQPRWGRLLRSAEDPRLFYSFGPWESREDILAMRATPDAANALARLAAMCDEFEAGPYEEIAEA
ncbi:MAG: antibiotic biosynthesis monooxygenase family protein, partial [Acidimicrobiales bacterium]